MVGRNWCVFGCPCCKKNNARTRRCGRGESFVCAMVASFEMKFASKKIAKNKKRWARGVDRVSCGNEKGKTLRQAHDMHWKCACRAVWARAKAFGCEIEALRVVGHRRRLDFVWQENRWGNFASFGRIRWGGIFFGAGMRMQYSWGFGRGISVFVRGRAGSESWGERRNLNSEGRVLRE